MTSMRLTAFAVATLMLGLSLGCQERGSSPSNESRGMFQRFLPVASVPESGKGVTVWSGAFALDTVTGQLCFTYEDAAAKQASIPLCRDLLAGKTR